MDANHKTIEIDGTLQCKWCDAPLGWSSLISDSVCWRCYALLEGAEMEPREIFGSIEQNSAQP